MNRPDARLRRRLRRNRERNIRKWRESKLSALTRVVLPVIRRVLPQVIANEIIGVQNTVVGPQRIFKLIPKYR